MKYLLPLLFLVGCSDADLIGPYFDACREIKQSLNARKFELAGDRFTGTLKCRIVINDTIYSIDQKEIFAARTGVRMSERALLHPTYMKCWKAKGCKKLRGQERYKCNKPCLKLEEELRQKLTEAK